MKLSTRAYNTLRKAGQDYGTEDVCLLTDKQLALVRFCGKKTVEELREFRKEPEEARAKAFEAASHSQWAL